MPSSSRSGPGVGLTFHAVALARRRAADDGADPHNRDRFDLILAFGRLRDMPHPDAAARAVRSVIAHDGVFLIKDIRCTGRFETDNRHPLLALFYGYSLTSCLQSAMSEPGGMAPGNPGPTTPRSPP